MNGEKKFSLITSIVIGILLVSMVCLCAIYLFNIEGTDIYDLSKEDVQVIKSGNARVAYSKNLDDSYILPDKICICSSIVDDMVLIGFDSQMNSLYGTIKLLYEDFFTDENLITKLEKEDGQSSYLYSLDSNGLLIVWDNPIPLSAIYYFSFPNNINEDIPDTIVRKMYFYGETNNYTCVIVDENGDFLIYRKSFGDAEANPYYNMISNVSTIGMVNFKFGFEYKETSNIFEPIQDDAIITEKVQLGGAIAIRVSQSEIADNTSLFENLDVNLIKATSYVSEDNTLVYMIEGKSIYIDDSGNVTYTSEGNNSLSLSSLINLKTNYDLRDYLGACVVLINKMNLDFGDAVLYLRNVYINEGYAAISFGLRYENINVQMYNNPTIMLFEFENDRLKRVEFHCMEITGTYDYVFIEQFDLLVKSSLLSDTVNPGVAYLLDEQSKSFPVWVNVIKRDKEASR